MRKKKERAKKVYVAMKPKIILKVAQAVDGEGASYSEASFGRLDWECAHCSKAMHVWAQKVGCPLPLLPL